MKKNLFVFVFILGLVFGSVFNGEVGFAKSSTISGVNKVFKYGCVKTEYKSLKAAKKDFYKNFKVGFGQCQYANIYLFTKFGKKKCIMLFTDNTTSARIEEIYFKHKKKIYKMDCLCGRTDGISSNGKYVLSYVSMGERYLWKIYKKKIKLVKCIEDSDEDKVEKWIKNVKKKYKIKDIKAKKLKV